MSLRILFRNGHNDAPQQTHNRFTLSPLRNKAHQQKYTQQETTTIKIKMETPNLKKTIEERDWEETCQILRDHPDLAKDQLSEGEVDVLWEDAPLTTIQVLLEAWPEAYETKDSYDRNLVQTKIFEQKWDFLKSLIHACPNIATAEDVLVASKTDVPLDIFKLILDQQPNAPLEEPYITFNLINLNKLDHFHALFYQCPDAADAKHPTHQLTPLSFMFGEKEHTNADWISPIFKANSKAAMQKDFDGKTPLHLAYQHGASSELIDMIQKAYPEGENERDNLGRFPRDLTNQSEKTAFTAANEALIFVYDVAANQSDRSNTNKASYPDSAVVLCRGDMLIRDLPAAQTNEDKVVFENYSQQVLVRHRIFETLLEEFSKMVGVDDKDVIQKAAATQALAARWLSNHNDTIINFGSFGNPGYWYQQEILKLVMRIYQETRSKLDDPRPSVWKDAEVCIDHLYDLRNGKPLPKPSDEHVKTYNELTRWLTEGLDKNSYSMQGPVLKPLQSLFNKLFIRRGQTSVSVIGDMVRGTLLVDNTESLQTIINRIKSTFPNITENKFRHPDKFDKLADFLVYVHNDLNALPSGNVLPYRFKANSSQKQKDRPLWYNLNFFLQIPEYHRVGFSEMFVACELQIGLAEEINKHRQTHVAYERDRILSNQPLLKNYDAMEKDENEDRVLQIGNCTEEDNTLIENILFGKIATEVLIPCTASAGGDSRNIILSFENGPFSLSRDDIKAGSFVKPKKLCLNNRSLNWYIINSPNTDDDGIFRAAFRAAGPYKLDETKRYFVESFDAKNIYSGGFDGTAGLYAHVGPYFIQMACKRVWYKSDDIVVVKSGQNFSYLEQMCPVPAGTTALEVIVYGKFSADGEFKYDEMNLSLKAFDIH